MAQPNRTEPKDISTELKASLANYQSNKPTTIKKRSDIERVENVVVSRGQATMFFDYWDTLGADDNIVTGDNSIDSSIVNKWFNILVARNERFPRDIPIPFVLDHFFKACIYNKVIVKGHNIMAHTRAFNEYMENYEHELRRDWWQKRNPGDRPKELAPTATVSKEEDSANNAERIENLKRIYKDDIPESIKRLIKTLED